MLGLHLIFKLFKGKRRDLVIIGTSWNEAFEVAFIQAFVKLWFAAVNIKKHRKFMVIAWRWMLVSVGT